MTECDGSGVTVDRLDPAYTAWSLGLPRVTCPECGQSLEAEDSSSEEGHYVLNYPSHEGDPEIEEAKAQAAEEDRRFEQYRDDEITARHTGGHDG